MIPESVTRPPTRGLLHRLWFQSLLPWLVVRLCVGAVRVTGAEQVPASGPVLFVGLHRAGLMDGWIHSHILPRRTVFLVAAPRLRQPWLRWLVTGIGVTRQRDGGARDGNRAALAACRQELHAGGTVFIFPEGTSSVGPGHLPFRPGAALLARSCPEATVVPLAIHYAAPARIGTGVEVVVGTPFRIPPGTSPDDAQAQVAAALEAIETPAPEPRASEPTCVGNIAAAARACVRGFAAALNAPPVAAMRLAARILPDGDNVVLVWAAVVGLPVQLLWSVAAVSGLLWAGLPWAALLYLAGTLLHAAWPARAYRHA